MSKSHFASLVIFLLAGAIGAGSVFGQVSGPPMGGRSGEFFGPPTGTVGAFLGTWNFSWAGPIDSKCPCRGAITIQMNQNADGSGLIGHWKKDGLDTVLHGAVSYDQNVWAGRFAQEDDSVDFPLRGYFRLEVQDAQTLTGSYQPEGVAVPFRWTGTRN